MGGKEEMNRYFIKYHSRTPSAIDTRKRQQNLPLSKWTFNFQNIKATLGIKDSIKNIDGVNLHTGLEIIADIEATSEEEAEIRSRDAAETVLTLINFLTLASCMPVKLTGIVDITNANTDKCPARYHIYQEGNDAIVESTRVLDEIEFRKLFDAYMKESYANPNKVHYAFTYLRKGIIEPKTIDQFLSYWIGLEFIEDTLRNNLEAKRIKERSLSQKLTKWDGVRDIFKNLGCDYFDTIKRARHDLLHGLIDPDNAFISTLTGYVPVVRKALIIALGQIVGLEDKNIMKIANKSPAKADFNPRIILKGTLSKLPSDFDKVVSDYLSIADLELNTRFYLDEKGDIKIEFKSKLSFSFPSGVVYKPRRAELRG
jgi:hypothetical protein